MNQTTDELYAVRVPLLDKSWYPSAPEGDLTTLSRSKLWSMLTHKPFAEALFIASPALFHEAMGVYSEQETIPQGPVSKLELALLKYALRATTRCTPFGAFSSNFFAINRASGADLASFEQMWTQPRTLIFDLDCVVLDYIIHALENDPTSYNDLNFIYSGLDFKWRGRRITNEVVKAQEFIYKRNNIQAPDIAEFILQYTYKKYVATEDLENAVENHFSVRNEPGFRTLLQNLMHSGLLQSHLRIDPYSPALASDLRKKILAMSPGTQDRFSWFLAVVDQIDALNATADPAARQVGIEKVLEEVHQATNLPLGTILRVESVGEGCPEVDFSSALRTALPQLQKALQLTAGLQNRAYEQSIRERYARKVSEKFSTSAMRLLDVIDSYVGCGVPGMFQSKHGDSTEVAFKLSTGMELLPHLNFAAVPSIHLPGPTADTALLDMDVFVMFAADQQIWLQPRLSTNKAGKALNRYNASLQRAGAAPIFQRYMTSTMNGLDVNYQPVSTRMLNVATKAFVTPHIALGTYIREDTTYLNELGLVADGDGLTVLDGQGKPTTASSLCVLSREYAPDSVKLMEFLWDAQRPELMPLNWETLALKQAQLPSLRYEDVILSPARWTVQSAAGDRPFGPLTQLAQRLLDEGRRYMMYGKLDNLILVDLLNPLHLAMIEDQATEGYLYETGIVMDYQPTYLGEYVLPLFAASSACPVDHAPRVIRGADQVVALEWMTHKLYYTSDVEGDELIKDILGHLQQHSEGPLFLVRYADPQPHLRVRLPAQLGLQTYLASSALATYIYRAETTPYIREYDRYTPHGQSYDIRAIDQLFIQESMLLLPLLNKLTNPRDKILFNALLMERHTGHLVFSEGTQVLMRRIVAANEDLLKINKRQVSAEIRTLRAYGLAHQADITQRCQAEIQQLEQLYQTLVPDPDVFTSLMHMWSNRLGLNRLEEYQSYRLAQDLMNWRMHATSFTPKHAQPA